ncbi:unnamed protein product [Blepharisma stoltei]|uniref:Uncharacterized protein n=1 Tax=Blepharisma stoltei TaxID=1481888 RepID=A0AAU9IN74_9CILI|nr:unnamed protein product [Blepharisma stoltei]
MMESFEILRYFASSTGNFNRASTKLLLFKLLLPCMPEQMSIHSLIDFSKPISFSIDVEAASFICFINHDDSWIISSLSCFIWLFKLFKKCEIRLCDWEFWIEAILAK